MRWPNEIGITITAKYLLFLNLILFGCTKEKIDSPTPIVVINEFVPTTNSGATFTGILRARGTKKIIEHGFEWRLKGRSNVDKIFLGPLVGSEFTVTVNRSLDKDANYDVRAFVFAENSSYYSDWTSFSGAGSSTFDLSKIEPEKATWGDTINLYGRNFSYNRDVVSVFFGGESADVLATTDTLVKVLVPASFVSSAVTKLKLKINSDFSEVKFELLPTIVSSISPNEGSSGTQVIVSGQNFNPNIKKITVGGVEVSLTEVKPTSIKWSVPGGLKAGLNDLSIKSEPFEVTLEKGFKRLYPEILEASSTKGFYGDTVVLKGRNFGKQFPDSHVTFGTNLKANSFELGDGFIKFVVPVVTSGKIDFRITADYTSSLDPFEFAIFEPKISRIESSGPVFPGDLITIHGDYFHPISSELKVDGLEMIEQNVSKNKIVARVSYMTTNSPIVELTSPNGRSTFSNAFIAPIRKIPSLPGGNRNGVASFILNGNPYVIGGFLGGNINNTDNQVWVFDAASSQWTKKSELFPGSAKYGSVGFSLNNAGYVLGSGGLTGFREFWKFDFSNDRWFRLNDITFSPVVAHELDGVIYVLSEFDFLQAPVSSVWKYNPVSDTWLKVTSLPFFYRNESNFSFVSGNSLFIGNRSVDDKFALFRLDEQTNQLISLGSEYLGRITPYVVERNSTVYTLGEIVKRYDPMINQWVSLKSASFLFGDSRLRLRNGKKWYFGFFGINELLVNPNPSVPTNLIYEIDADLLEN